MPHAISAMGRLACVVQRIEVPELGYLLSGDKVGAKTK